MLHHISSWGTTVLLLTRIWAHTAKDNHLALKGYFLLDRWWTETAFLCCLILSLFHKVIYFYLFLVMKIMHFIATLAKACSTVLHIRDVEEGFWQRRWPVKISNGEFCILRLQMTIIQLYLKVKLFCFVLITSCSFQIEHF